MPRVVTALPPRRRKAVPKGTQATPNRVVKADAPKSSEPPEDADDTDPGYIRSLAFIKRVLRPPGS